MSTQNPTLAGAQRGLPRPWREVPGGIALDTEEGLEIRPCALRVLKHSVVVLCDDYARQYLAQRGDGKFTQGQLVDWSIFLQLHHALIEVPVPGGPHVPMFQLPPTLSDEKGKINVAAMNVLPLRDAVDGSLSRIYREYEILKETETPVSLTHQQWEAIVSEGKDLSLRTLVSQHGSSALIQVLHGMGSHYPE